MKGWWIYWVPAGSLLFFSWDTKGILHLVIIIRIHQCNVNNVKGLKFIEQLQLPSQLHVLTFWTFTRHLCELIIQTSVISRALLAVRKTTTTWGRRHHDGSLILLPFLSAYFFSCSLDFLGRSVWSWGSFRKRMIFSIVASWYSWDHLYMGEVI